MKKSKYIIISILILNLFNSKTNTEFIKLADFEIIQKKSLYRIALLPSLLCLTAYLSHNKLTDNIKNHPCTSALFLYLIGNYLIDSYYQYQKIKSVLDILKSSEKINTYLLCAILLKKDKHLFKNNPQTIQQIISEKIDEHDDLHIIEIEEFIANINKKALKYLNKFDAIHFEFQFNDLATLLLKENFTLDQIVNLFEKDPEIHQELILLQNNQNINTSKILEKLNSKIKYEIQLLLEKKLKD